jgi:hypothetical protein
LGKVVSDVGTTLKETFQPILKGIKSVFDSVKTAVMNSKDEFQAFWDAVKFIAPLIGKAIGAALNVIGNIAETLIPIFAKVLSAIKPLINTAIDGINIVIRGLNLIRTGPDIPYVKKIGEGASAGGFSGTMPNGQAFSTSAPVDQTAAEKALLAASVAESLAFAKVVAGQSQGVTAAQSAAATAAAASTGIIAGSNFNPGSFRAGEEASMGTTINLTVNGALDREGTARTIVETLNDSFYRGTGGANSLQIA